MSTFIKRRLKNMKIFNKLFLSCLLVTLMISLISGGITYYIASGIILNKTVMQTEETVRQISENYDSYMELIYSKLEYLAFNPTVQEELLSKFPEREDEGYYSGSRKLTRLLVQMYNSKDMRDMEIYGDNGNEYFCALQNDPLSFSNTEDLKEKARENKGAITCINDREVSGDMQVLKEIRDTLSMQSLGVLRTSIRLSALERISQNVDFASSGKILLLDDNNKLILGEESQLTRKADLLFINWNDSFKYTIDGISYQVVYQLSQKTGWKTIGIIPSGEITKSIMPLQTGTAVMLLAGLGLSLVLSLIMSYIMGRPIKNTVGALKRFSNGDFTVRLETGRKDEFGQMNQVFNSTIEKVEHLLDEISYSRTLNKEMEFKSLQAKINPHFLYNALDTVNWLAYKEGEGEICDMVSAVSSLLRISISNKEAVFTVEKELRYVKDYLYIQKIRYRDRFETVFDIEEEVSRQLIPKLTIQPLIENAIVHSVEVSKEKTVLTIAGHREGSYVMITVSDTGVGIPEETLRALRNDSDAKVENIQESHTGLGVYAVSKRIKYLYGEDSGLSVFSKEGEGTQVVIRFPYQTDLEEVLVQAERLSYRRPENGT